MNDFRRFIIKNGVKLSLNFIAFFARRPSLEAVSDRLTVMLANVTLKRKKITPADSLQKLGEQWQKGFPSSKQVPITSIDDNTVYAEIKTPCPLRGGGDTRACHRMMNYDRRIVDRAGGNFVVLRSQAEPGVTVCKVAMRWKGEPLDNLQQAHLRG